VGSGHPGQGFRPDVQGMRALAVGLVILSHAGFRTFSGGFIGVDVFFVISGFLITGLLLREADASGRVSLLGFYARRARRILPAAVVVLVATVLASLLVLPLVRVLEIATDSIWAVLFAANIRFAVVGTDYFAQGEPTSPVQHYWSLAVEEQFYLVWPLLLIAALLLARRRGRRPDQVLVPLAGLVVVLMAVSVVWSLVATHGSPVTAYFSTLTRAWELGAGALCAIALRWRPVRAPRAVLEAGGAGGLLLILAGALAFDAETPFPGYAAAVPVLGTVLLLASGAGPEPTAVGRLLAIRPARVLGDWSYSLYLWHWPVLRIAEDHQGVARLPLLDVAGVLVLVLVLSAATYHLVEEPFRRGRLWARPRFGVALYPVSVVVVLAVALGGRGWVDHQLGGDAPAISTAEFADQRLSADPQVALVQASVLAAREGQAVPGDLEPPLPGIRKAVAPLGDCDYRTGTEELCAFGDADADRSLVLIGDSHARAWSPAFDELGREHGYATYNLVYSGCSATTAVQADRDTGRAFAGCEEFKTWAASAIAELEPDLVVVATSAVSPVLAADGDRVVGMVEDRAEFLDLVVGGYGELLQTLQQSAGEVLAIGNTPKLPREPGVCLSTGDVDLGDCLLEEGKVSRKIQRAFAQEAARLDVPFVSASRWFCFERECPAVVGRTVTMRDSEHMTPEYARQLAEPVARALRLDR